MELGIFSLRSILPHFPLILVMMKRLSFLVALSLISIIDFGQVKLQSLLVENLPDPVGIDVPQPRFSWQLVSTKRNSTQLAYEIKVTAGKSPVWSSGKINSGQSVLVTYAGAALQSGKKYNWQVRV